MPLFDRRPGAILRSILRLPALLYLLRLGWLLGDRFLLLEHTGRSTGRLRSTVLEVIESDPSGPAYYAVSGWGKSADWYLNIRKHPDVRITVGRQRLHSFAELIPMDEGERVLVAYKRSHTFAARILLRLAQKDSWIELSRTLRVVRFVTTVSREEGA